MQTIPSTDYSMVIVMQHPQIQDDFIEVRINYNL